MLWLGVVYYMSDNVSDFPGLKIDPSFLFPLSQVKTHAKVQTSANGGEIATQEMETEKKAGT
jgi:hypothetical protein